MRYHSSSCLSAGLETVVLSAPLLHQLGSGFGLNMTTQCFGIGGVLVILCLGLVCCGSDSGLWMHCLCVVAVILDCGSIDRTTQNLYMSAYFWPIFTSSFVERVFNSTPICYYKTQFTLLDHNYTDHSGTCT